MPTAPRPHPLRRAASLTAWGGGGLTVLGAAGYGLLKVQAQLARRAIGDPLGHLAPVPPRRFGAGAGAPLRLVVLGDSSAAGLGAVTAEQTPAAIIAGGLAAVSGQSVELLNAAVVGAVSADLGGQVDRALGEVAHPDVVVVMIGANDVTHRVRTADAVRPLAEAVTRLRAAGAEVVVGTCPDFGALEPLAPPLRYVAQRLGRELAAAQTVAVVGAGGRTVSLGGLLGPAFHDSPREMFARDGFHPSPAGYARVAAVLLPTVGAALGLWYAGEPDGVTPVGPVPGDGPGRDGSRGDGSLEDGSADDGGAGRGGAGSGSGSGSGTEGAGAGGGDHRRRPRWDGWREALPLRHGPHTAVPLVEAAAAAAAVPGTEVAPAEAPDPGPRRVPVVAGAGAGDRDPEDADGEVADGVDGAAITGGGPRARWALSFQRRRTPVPRPSGATSPTRGSADRS